MKNYLTLICLLYSISQPAISKIPDHTEWTRLLKDYTRIEGSRTIVLYTQWKKAGQQSLDQYLKKLSALSKKEFDELDKKDQLAFLINAYNAFTVKLMLNHFPLKSIKDIGTSLDSPWRKKFFSLLGEKTYLDHIEHDLIRKKFKEPRIHFAVNCASYSCPELKPEAYLGSKLENQLHEAESVFLLDSSKMSFEDNKVGASKIFEWYGEDFKAMYRSVDSYILQKGKELKKLPPDLKSLEIHFLEYDWKLNGE